MRELIRKIAEVQAGIARALDGIPLWKQVVEVAARFCSPVTALARGSLRVIPPLRKLEWLLEIESLTRRHPVLLAVAMIYAAWRGLKVTPLGHIGTDPIIYPMLGAISGFNPFLGLVCGVMYGIGDLIQKFFVPDMFGAKGWMDPNYWGGMIGYVVAYSSVMIMGVFPGMLSRVFRAGTRLAIRQFFTKRAAAAADGAVLGPAANPVADLIAAAAGGYAGGWLVMHQVAPVTERPAFLWRPNPDVSCHHLEVNTHLKGRAGVGGVGAALGGGIGPLTPPPGGPPPGGYGPEHDAAVKARDKALDEYDRIKKQWEDAEASADKSDPNYERLRQQYQAYLDSLKQQAVAADARSQAIADAAEQAKNTRVLRGADGRDYEIVYDPKEGRWRNAESGNYFDPDEFNRWQQDLAKNRAFMDAENEKSRRREDWFSKEMDRKAAEAKARADAAAYVARVQQAALKHDLWNPGGPGDVVGTTDKILKDIHDGKPIDWQKIGAARKYTGDRISGAAADESTLRNQPGLLSTVQDAAWASAREAITGRDADGNATFAGSVASIFGRVTAGVVTGGASEVGYVGANMWYAGKDAAARGASDLEIFKATFKTGVLEAAPTLGAGSIGHYFPKYFPNVAQGVGEMLQPVGKALGKAVGALDDAVQQGSKSLSNRVSRLFNPIPETLAPTRQAVSRVLGSTDPSDLSKLYSEGGMDRLAKLQKAGALSPDEARALNTRLGQRVNANIDKGMTETIEQFERETGVRVKGSALGDSGSSARPGGNPKAMTDFDRTHVTTLDPSDLKDYAAKRGMSLEQANAELQKKFGGNLTEQVDRNLRADGFKNGAKDVDFKAYDGIGKGAGQADAYPPGFTGGRQAVQGQGKMFERGADGQIRSHNISGQAVVDQAGLNAKSVTGKLPENPTRFGADEFKDFSQQQVRAVTGHSDVKSMAKAMGREADMANRIDGMSKSAAHAGDLKAAGLPSAPPQLDPKLVTVSSQINKNPSDALKILKRNGFTEKSYADAVKQNVTSYHNSIGGAPLGR